MVARPLHQPTSLRDMATAATAIRRSFQIAPYLTRAACVPLPLNRATTRALHHPPSLRGTKETTVTASHLPRLLMIMAMCRCLTEATQGPRISLGTRMQVCVRYCVFLGGGGRWWSGGVVTGLGGGGDERGATATFGDEGHRAVLHMCRATQGLRIFLRHIHVSGFPGHNGKGGGGGWGGGCSG